MRSDFLAVQIGKKTPVDTRTQVVGTVKANVDVNPVKPEARDVSAVVIGRIAIHVLMLK